MSSLSRPNKILITSSRQRAYGKHVAERSSSYVPINTTWQASRLSIALQRALDICGACIGLLFLIIVLAPVALVIYLDDPGPIFYRQQRIGRYGQPFYIYKFRSMIQQADSSLRQLHVLHASWQQRGKLTHDPRVTRAGRFLRRSSLDELPQMLNILRGEMSLVGPRAIQFSEVAEFGEFCLLRQVVRPGLTGLWQISGRSHTTYEQRKLLDCMYVMERSISMDLRILYATVSTVLLGKGAY